MGEFAKVELSNQAQFAHAQHSHQPERFLFLNCLFEFVLGRQVVIQMVETNKGRTFATRGGPTELAALQSFVLDG
ncbi:MULTISPECIES: hypothetical protein [Methylomicrobium]|uniref:hypothetical protein n=1 Tax=Methylomicrobium TaxID=39773 RepID=UPI0002623FAD|nr:MULTISPECIES: hypothetical protein [Methylomicrobium]